MFNCTSPFVPQVYRDGADICRNESDGRLVHGYMLTSTGRFSTNMWRQDYFFMPPCTYNTYNYIQTDGKKVPNNHHYVGINLKRRRDKTKNLDLYFNSKMFVTEQFWSYTFLAYIAECGGFVGLFLGYSILQIGDVLQYLCIKFNIK